MMNPSWATLEYATTNRASGVVMATSVPHRTETSARTSISVWKWTAAYGNSGITIRRNPYAATLDRIAENTAIAGIGITL